MWPRAHRRTWSAYLFQLIVVQLSAGCQLFFSIKNSSPGSMFQLIAVQSIPQETVDEHAGEGQDEFGERAEWVIGPFKRTVAKAGSIFSDGSGGERWVPR